MGTPFKLDDLLGGQHTPTDAKPPQKKKPDGFALDELLGSETAAAPAAPAAPVVPATTPAARNGAVGDVDLRTPADTGAAPVVPPAPAPAPRRGIGARISDAIGSTVESAKPTLDALGTAASVIDAAQHGLAPLLPGATEYRTPATIEDHRTPAQKLAATKARIVAMTGQRPDAAQVRPSGSPMQVHEDERTAESIQLDRERRGRFTPEKWREIARQGAEYANRLHAEGRHDEAEDANRKAYNAQLIADGAANADTFGAIALSSLLGIVADPYAQDKANLLQIEREQSTFTPEEQQSELGSTTPVEMRRGFDPTKDITAPLVGSLPLYVAGGAAGRGIALTGAELLGGAEAAGARGFLSRGLARLASEAEVTGIPEGELLSGRAGVRQAVENYRANIGTLVQRGATEGQIIGAAQAAREAQQTGEDPATAAAGALLLGAPMGIAGELAFGAAARALPLVGRTITSGIRRTLDDLGSIGILPEESDLARVTEAAREVKGQTPLADQTVTGQRATIAKMLGAVLDEKKDAENFGSESGLILRDPTALEPRPVPVEENPPLRSAREVGLERGGYVEPGPSDEANAVVQMERARAAAAAEQRLIAEDAERARIEQAAAASAAQKQGPLTLSQTLARATREASAQEPLAVEYHTAINRFADAMAAMKDAGEHPSEKVRVNLARARTALNEARQKYGRYAGSAALIALATADEDLTDDERESAGLSGLKSAALLGAGLTIIPERLPVRVREQGRAVIDRMLAQAEAAGTKLETRSAADWLSALNDGVKLGRAHSAVQDALSTIAGHDFDTQLTPTQVRAIFKEPAEREGLTSRGFTSRLRMFTENLPGKQWDSPRPVADWLGKLGGTLYTPKEVAARRAALLAEQPIVDVDAMTTAELRAYVGKSEKQVPDDKLLAVARGKPANDVSAQLQREGYERPIAGFSRAELDLIMPALREAAQQKRKLSRADLLALIDEKLPQIDRVTLAELPHTQAAPATPDRIDVDEIERGLNTTHFRDDIDEQINVRNDRIEEITQEITDRQEEAKRDYENASENVSEQADEVRRTLGRFEGQIDVEDAMERIQRILSERVDSDGAHDGPERAFEEIASDLHVQDEVRDPADDGFDIEYRDDPDDVTEEIVTVTSPNGNEYEGKSLWEAMGKAEAEGDYDSGSRQPLFPPGATVEREPTPERMQVFRRNADGSNGYHVHTEHMEGRTPEQVRQYIHDVYAYRPEFFNTEHQPAGSRHEWVVYGAPDENGHRRVLYRNSSRSGMTRGEFTREYVDYRFEPKVDSGDLSELESDIATLGYRMAEEMDAESRNYYYNEQPEDAFYDEWAEREQLQEEVGTLSNLWEQAKQRHEVEPAQAELPATTGRNALLDPIPVESRGGVHYSTYQRIPGGTNYRELVNSWANPSKAIPEEAYGGHDYWTNKGAPNAIGHLRAEDHIIQETPGLMGEKVEIPSEDAPPRLRQAYIDVADVRGRRNAALKKMNDVERALEALPPDETDPRGTISARAQDLLDQWQRAHRQVIDLAKREDQLAADVRNLRGSLLSEDAPEPRRVLNILETQTSLSQHQATLDASGVGPEDVPRLQAEYEDLQRQYDALTQQRDDVIVKLGEVEQGFWSFYREHDDARLNSGQAPTLTDLRQRLETAGQPEVADLIGRMFSPQYIDDEALRPAWDMLAEDPQWKQIIDSLRDLKKQTDDLYNERMEVRTRYRAASRLLVQAEKERPDVGPFGEIANAQQYNAARAIIEWAEGDYDDLMWSDAPNRIKNANLQRKAAYQWYDGVFGSAIKRAFGFAGFKVDIDHVFVNGEGHWRIRGTPAMREKIRKYGVPAMSVAAMMAAPDDAEAQDGTLHESANLYGTFAGGVAAGALVMAMATNKRVRRLVKENRAVNRALMLDDLSGLSNQRAFHLAVPSVDRDPETAWVVFDANRFKSYNDYHGHAEGDKVIKHFGEVIRSQVQALDVPPRMFRAGGDEFAVAVPKARAAAVLRAIEDASAKRKGPIEVSLTGAIGDTYDEADVLVGATKTRNALVDPTLARGWTPGAPKVERPEINAKLKDEVDKALATYASSSPEAGAVMKRVRSGKINAQTMLALAAVPVTAAAGYAAGNTPEERRSYALLAGVAAALAVGGAAAGERIAAAMKDVKVQRALRDEDSRAIEWMLLKDEMLAERAKREGHTAEQQLFVESLRETEPLFASTPTSEGMQARADAQRAEELIDETNKPSFLYTRPHDIYSNPIGPALSELRKYPSAAAIGVIGYAMTDSDNEQVRRAGVPTMALAALSAIGSRRIMAGADFLGTKLVDALRQSETGTKTVRLFNPDALLDPEVRSAIIQFERDHAKGVARAAEFSGKAKRLGPVSDRAVSDVLDNENWEDIAHLSAEQQGDILTVAAQLKEEYDRLTQAQLATGTLKASQVLPDYGGPRRYAYFDAHMVQAEHPRADMPSRNARITATKTRTLDIPLREAENRLKAAQATGTPEEIAAARDALDEAKAVQLSRRVELGEIREASYRAAIGIEKAHTNVASAKLFETIRNVPGSAHPDWVAAVDDMLAAKEMYRTAASDGDREAANLMQHEAAARLDKITRTYARAGGDYVSLSDTPGLGALRGAVVKRDIAHSLEGFGKPGAMGKAIRAWKELKTVFNVGTSIGNILSNVAALHVGDIPIWLQPHYLTEAVKDLRAYGEATRALAEAGVLGVNETTARGTGEVGRSMRSREGMEELLLSTRPETRSVLREQGITEEAMISRYRSNRTKRALAGAAIGGMKEYDSDDPESTLTGAAIGAGVGALFTGAMANKIRRFYGNEDNVARIAVFLRRRKLGDTVEQATNAAINSLGDFRTRSPMLRGISNSVSPFVLYQAKAVPAFARSVVDHPWKYLTLMAAWGAMNELSKQEVGEVPERDIPVADRKSYGYFFPGFTQLPFADERGNRAATDMARWTPMSGLTTGAPPGSVPEAFSDNATAFVSPGGPVLDASAKLLNIDPFTRDPIVKRDRPVGENVEAVSHTVADFVLPSALGYHTERLKQDMANEDWTKFKNDLLGPTGAKPRYVRPGAVSTDALYTLRKSLMDMKQEARRALRANKNPERASEIMRDYHRRAAQAMMNFRERMGVAPPPDTVNEFLTPEQ